ncbi:dipeptidyl peptidase III [Penicillium malachiteum]|nr:dipeptidyl peptidase III [Penicillium malachiteum]
MSSEILTSVPWSSPENNGKGPFERSDIETPDLHSSRVFWEASNINLVGTVVHFNADNHQN